PGRPTASELPVVLSGYPFGKLIGRVGSWVFPVGKGAKLTAQQDGELRLLMNDRIGYYGDNSGALRVTAERKGMMIGGPTGIVSSEFARNPARFSRIDASVQLTLTDGQRSTLLRLVNEWNSKNYSLLERNCIDFMHSALVTMGFDPPERGTFQRPVE